VTKPIRLAVLLSGGGTTLENIFEHIETRDLPAEVALVVSSKPDAFGLERARRRGIDSAVVESAKFRKRNDVGCLIPDWESMSHELTNVILAAKPDLVCLAGFMCMYILPPELTGKVMNIHPALIPAFCGKGMYGHHVHEAVAAAGVKITGCTVHFVTNEYDAGPIILQKCCPVLFNDTPDEIAARVFEQECEAYPEAIRLFAEDRLEICGNRVRVTTLEKK
jgi:formyltetrahydrofolate-dependent phosphoribosylglycinamide formyltransferase